jgi:lysophospholipase L1-like esterase
MIAEYTYDGVHCTAKGYEVMETLVQKAIQNALKNKQKN